MRSKLNEIEARERERGRPLWIHRPARVEAPILSAEFRGPSQAAWEDNVSPSRFLPLHPCAARLRFFPFVFLSLFFPPRIASPSVFLVFRLVRPPLGKIVNPADVPA